MKEQKLIYVYKYPEENQTYLNLINSGWEIKQISAFGMDRCIGCYILFEKFTETAQE